MKKTSIGTWAYNVGPYGESPIPFDTVGETLSKLKFDGMELGGFNGYPNPHNHPGRMLLLDLQILYLHQLNYHNLILYNFYLNKNLLS